MEKRKWQNKGRKRKLYLDACPVLIGEDSMAYTKFHWYNRKAEEAGPGTNPAIPSATCLFNTLLPRVMGRREGHGVAAPGPCLDAGRRRLVARPLPVWHPCDQSLHTRWHALGLGLFFPLLGLQPTYLALERLAASSQIGRTSQMGTESTVPTRGKKTCEPREIS